MPELRFEVSGDVAGTLELLDDFDPGELASMMPLLGLADPGPPIRVVVAAEGTPEARWAPSWGVAYAVGNAGLVVLLPNRVSLSGDLAYPDRNLETVLRHEVAHVLIARAARRRPVPRWFNEGLAIYAAREWRLEDRGRVALALFGRDDLGLRDLDRSFQGGAHSAGQAYALSAAFVRFVLQRYGELTAARTLDRIGDGMPFEEAFHYASGVSLEEAEAAFWHHLDIWNRWVPFLTSSATLWIAVTALALWAFKRRRERDAERLRQWEEEEARALERERLARLPTDAWIH
jgi:hypothetical protein